jgi:hypothetical protein
MRAHLGDTLIVEGDHARTGIIIGVPHADGSPPYIVKWLADGHIAMVSPGEFARVVPADRRGGLASGDSVAVGSLHVGEQRSDVIRHKGL